MSAASYESIVGMIDGLSPSPLEARHVRWVTDAEVVGVARAHDGKIEVFLSGERLASSSPVIDEVLEYQSWFREDGLPELQANRLLLPAVGHFNQVAAFICTEFIRNDADRDLARAFAETEPILELALRRLRMADQALVGLAGELLLLDSLCQNASDGEVPSIISGWDGWKESLRDLVIGDAGVEVKTTTSTASSHQIHGLHQIELRDGADGGDRESILYLVSIGVQWASEGDTFSVPALVDSIVSRIQAAGRPDMVDMFLAHVCDYGASSGTGYDHRSMSQDQRFARSFIVRFVRGYDMTDPNIQVLRSPEVLTHVHVALRSVAYRLDLPATVTGNLNPIVGLHAVANALVR